MVDCAKSESIKVRTPRYTLNLGLSELGVKKTKNNTKNKNSREVAAEVEETRVSAVSITSNQVLVAAVRDIFCLFVEEVFSYPYRIPFPLFC